jgi:hypothetical protein
MILFISLIMSLMHTYDLQQLYKYLIWLTYLCLLKYSMIFSILFLNAKIILNWKSFKSIRHAKIKRYTKIVIIQGIKPVPKTNHPQHNTNKNNHC